jgi:hypothetical protein
MTYINTTMKIYLLDPNSEIFQSFQDANQLYGFLNRCTRNMRGKVLIVRNKAKAHAYDLTNESPAEIHMIVLKLQNELK